MQFKSVYLRILKFCFLILIVVLPSVYTITAKTFIIKDNTYIDIPLNNNDKEKEATFKRLALDFAEQGDAEQSSHYIEKYIKSSLDIKFINSDGFELIKNEKPYQLLRNKYLKKIDFWSIFCLYVGFTGIFIFTILIMKKGGDRMAKILLGSFLLLHSIFILRISVFLTNYEYYLPHSLYVSAAFSFLYGPIIYFYFKRILQKYSFKPLDLIHLLPTILFLVGMSPIYVLSEEEKLSLIINNERPFMEIISFLKIISLSIYSFFLLKLFLKSKKLQNSFSKQERIWQRNIIIFTSLYIVSYGVYIALMNDLAIRGVFFHLQIILMSLLVLYISYNSFINLNTSALKVIKNDKIPEENAKAVFIDTKILPNSDHNKPAKTKLNSPPEIIISNEGNGTKSKYQKSNLTDFTSGKLKKSLLELMEVQKVYRQNDLTLPKLAEELGTTRNIASQIINESFGLNFFELINKYRIQEAKDILNSRNHINIIDVAYEVGYNNKVTFNKSFKKLNKVTPSEYLRSKSA